MVAVKGRHEPVITRPTRAGVWPEVGDYLVAFNADDEGIAYRVVRVDPQSYGVGLAQYRYVDVTPIELRDIPPGVRPKWAEHLDHG